MMLGLPSFQMGDIGKNLSPVDSVAAGAGDRVIRIGQPYLIADIQTLNPLTYTMGSEFQIIWPCYSTMLIYDVNNKVRGDLAKSWSMSPDGLVWTFEIVNNAKFYDRYNPTADHPLTVDDIIYTYYLIQNTTGNFLGYYFPEIPGVGPLIADMQKITDYKMTMTLSTQYAAFVSGLLGVPILPKYVWSLQDWDWDNFDPPDIAAIIGSGPFVYNLPGMPAASTIELIKSPTWFATEEYGWQIHVDRLLWMSQTIDSNLLAFTNGDIDIMTWPTNEQFITLPRDANHEKWTSSQGFVFEFVANQLSDANRTLWDIGGPTDWNNQLLQDPVIKLAMAMSIDKDAIVRDVLGGMGSVADSLVPPASPWHYWYGVQPSEDPINGRAPVGEEPIVFDTAAARQLLIDNGWAYTTTGAAAPADYYPLCKAGGTDPLRFRMFSPNDMTEFIEGSQLIDLWNQQAGIDLQYGAVSPNQANTLWFAGDYDTWYWDFWFDPTSDPSTDCMEVLTTGSIGVWSGTYWSNATYDALYYESLKAMNPDDRMVILDEMQRMVYEEFSKQLVAYMDMLYAAQTVAPDYWVKSSYGNWTQKYPLIPDAGFPWLYTQIYPQDNPSPQITSFTTEYETDTVTPVQFTATVQDTDPKLYRWNFGDGTKSPWSSSPDVQHLYPVDGYYDAYFMAKEDGTADGFMTWGKAKVTVIDMTNTPPHTLDFTIDPTDPDSGTQVWLNGTALDDNPGDTLSYSWNFGDGDTGGGQNVQHQFTEGLPSYTVTMYVTDNHLGQQPRPVSYSGLVTVSANSPPTCVVPNFPAVSWKTNYPFAITSTDVNPRDSHRYTWDWDDGEVSVTTTTSTTHWYARKGTYNITVWADDLTGLAGHNVSDWGLATVIASDNLPPTPTEFYVDDDTPVAGQVVTFTCNATDPNNDLLVVTVDFGDLTSTTVTQTAANTSVQVTHMYAEGFYLASMSVYDGQSPPEMFPTQILMSVSPGNQPPVIDPLPDFYRTTGDLVTLSATATDPELDPLKYTWDPLGDGSELIVGQSIDYAYALPSWPAAYGYRVWVDDGQGNNVSEVASAYINSLPVLSDYLDRTVDGGVLNTYSAVVNDMDLDTMTVTWDFGDGSAFAVGESVDYAYASVGSITTYTLTIWVLDGFTDDVTGPHNVSDTATITVLPVDSPPVADAGSDQTKMAGELVTLDGSLSSDDNGIVSWTWNFDDGATPVELYGETVDYIWAIEGVYTVTLTVEDTIGQTDTDTCTVTISGIIPEFPLVIVPVAGLLAVVVLVSLRRRRGQLL